MWFVAVVAALVAALTPTLDAAPAPPPAEHTDWDVTNRTRLDVDGDGTRELLLVRENPRGDHPPEIAVHWADGRVEASRVRGRFFDDVVRGYAVDDRPGEELMVRDIVSYRWSVWAHRHREWERLTVVRPELLRDSVARNGHGHGVLLTGPRLVSHRSVEPFDVGYDYAFPPAPTYAVETWRWTWRGERLVPRPTGRRCISAQDGGGFVRCP